jgi:hypothetical protein
MASDEQIEILDGPLAGGVPPVALAAYGRWWQLETYLREVAYTELRAAFGLKWAEHLSRAATTRAERDQVNAYMASADADEPLAYADASVLFGMIKEKWDVFEPVLLPQVRWDGLVDELLTIRNRSAHWRPHRDEDWFGFLRTNAESLPAKVQSGTALALLESHRPEAFTIFAA